MKQLNGKLERNLSFGFPTSCMLLSTYFIWNAACVLERFDLRTASSRRSIPSMRKEVWWWPAIMTQTGGLSTHMRPFHFPCLSSPLEHCGTALQPCRAAPTVSDELTHFGFPSAHPALFKNFFLHEHSAVYATAEAHFSCNVSMQPRTPLISLQPTSHHASRDRPFCGWQPWVRWLWAADEVVWFWMICDLLVIKQ